MAYFNRTMKTLLKQETKDSLSNAGWDEMDENITYIFIPTLYN